MWLRLFARSSQCCVKIKGTAIYSNHTKYINLKIQQEFTHFLFTRFYYISPTSRTLHPQAPELNDKPKEKEKQTKKKNRKTAPIFILNKSTGWGSSYQFFKSTRLPNGTVCSGHRYTQLLVYWIDIDT